MAASNPNSPRKSSLRWLIAAIIAAILWVGGVAGNLVANDLAEPLAPYRLWVWGFCGVALIVAVIAAVWEARRSNTTAPTTNELHRIESPPRDFTGRAAELKELMNAIERGGVTIVGLQGMGGVGKTTLALKLAEQLKARYPDAQLLLDLEGLSLQPHLEDANSPRLPAGVVKAMTHVIHSYRPKLRSPNDEAEISGVYQSVLDGQRALLLLDNARDEEQVKPLLPSATCVVLVTSRQHFTVPGMLVKNVDVLPQDDARKLLLKISSRIGPHAGALAEQCGYLPFALRLAASALEAERRNLSPQEYIARLADARQRLELIEASLSLSYDLLRTELQQRWCVLAIFPETFDAALTAAVWDVKPNAAQDGLGELLAYSMVEWNEAPNRYRLHDLARVFADSRLDEATRTTAQRRHAAYYATLLREIEQLYDQGGDALRRGLKLFDAEWPNIRVGQAWVNAHAEDDNETARLCIDYPNAGASVLGLRQHPRERIVWLDAALTAAQRLQDRQGESAVLCSLGNAHEDLGEMRRAIELYEQAIVVLHESGDHRGEGAVLGNLGIVYENLGETRRAIEFHRRALSIAHEAGDHRREGHALGNLGLAYTGLGEYRHAIEFHEQALVISLEIGDRSSEGHDLGNLGNAYRHLGELHRAIELYEQCLAIAREIGDRHDEGATLGNLGGAYFVLGETRRAIEFYEKALVIAREVGNRRGEGNVLWNMSLALDKLGNRAESIAHAEAALKIREQIEDPNAAKVREQLAEWRRKSSGIGMWSAPWQRK